MGDDETIAAASTRGWNLVELAIGQTSVWRWAGRADELSPTFREREAAIAWMRDRLTRKE
jgi:hypothetical protein